MKIRVTKEDIEKGKQGECSKCPVALAIIRKFPGKKIEVSNEEIVIGRMTLVTPADVSSWIFEFDGSEEVSPVTFTLHMAP